MEPDTTLLLSSPGNKNNRHALRVTVVTGPDVGKSYTIDETCVVVGRSKRADVCLSDPTVSEFHIELSYVHPGIRFQDLKSKNGVLVAGVLVERGSAFPGSLLTLGKTTLQVEVAEPLQVPVSNASMFGRLLGGSQAMRELYARMAKLAPTDLSILIQGETGTGKELAARALHEASLRGHGPFRVLDCATLQDSLANDRLFGHEKGSFTDAKEAQPGIFEEADGGTLFIDEIGDLPRQLQPLLLRVLQEREVVRIGSHKARSINVRIVCATLKDLRMMVNSGTFREDLYYRIAGATITMPSLAQRREDIGLLVHHFLARLPSRTNAARAITDEALAELSRIEIRGNVRELQQLTEQLAMLAQGSVITLDDVLAERLQTAEQKRKDAQDETSAPPIEGGPIAPFKHAKREAVDDFERSYLKKLLAYAGNNLTYAAAIAGLERHSLRALLKKHGLYQSQAA